jgi:hypothetical protein
MKMKIALMALTADVSGFCDKTLNLPEFKGSEATVTFTRS